MTLVWLPWNLAPIGEELKVLLSIAPSGASAGRLYVRKLLEESRDTVVYQADGDELVVVISHR